MKTLFKQFIGKNWFEHRGAIDAAAQKAGLHTNLKVKGDKIHGSHLDLLDVPDIDVEDDRLTVTIHADGKILSIYQG